MERVLWPRHLSQSIGSPNSANVNDAAAHKRCPPVERVDSDVTQPVFLTLGHGCGKGTLEGHQLAPVDPRPCRMDPRPLKRWPQWSASAAPTSTFFGSQPRSAHVPPKGRESMMATVHPAFRHRGATDEAADPVPMTMRSYRFTGTARIVHRRTCPGTGPRIATCHSYCRSQAVQEGNTRRRIATVTMTVANARIAWLSRCPTNRHPAASRRRRPLK